jgi:hypothetical protein
MYVRLAFAVAGPTWSRRFCWLMKCWRWGMGRFRRKEKGRMKEIVLEIPGDLAEALRVPPGEQATS